MYPEVGNEPMALPPVHSTEDETFDDIAAWFGFVLEVADVVNWPR
jgi:hypothetical protein